MLERIAVEIDYLLYVRAHIEHISYLHNNWYTKKMLASTQHLPAIDFNQPEIKDEHFIFLWMSHFRFICSIRCADWERVKAAEWKLTHHKSSRWQYIHRGLTRGGHMWHYKSRVATTDMHHPETKRKNCFQMKQVTHYVNQFDIQSWDTWWHMLPSYPLSDVF